MNFTDEKFLKFIQSGRTGKVYHRAQHKDLKNKEIYIVLSSFNFNGSPGSNVYSLDLSEDLSDFPIKIATVLISSKIKTYSHKVYFLDKDNKRQMKTIDKDQFFLTINNIGLEYPLVANFFLWNLV